MYASLHEERDKEFSLSLPVCRVAIAKSLPGIHNPAGIFVMFTAQLSGSNSSSMTSASSLLTRARISATSSRIQVG